MNMLETAIKLELQGMACYQNLAAATRIAGLETVFQAISSEKMKHLELLRLLKQGKTVLLPQSEVLERAQKILLNLTRDRENMVSAQQDLEGCRFAAELALESVRFYEEQVKRATSPELAAFCGRLIDEEKRYFNILENVFEMLTYPRRYLTWREFSTLRELVWQARPRYFLDHT